MKKVFTLLLGIFVLLSFTNVAQAQTSYMSYLDKDGNSKTAEATTIDAATSKLTEGWYYVFGDINRSGTVVVSGDVHLILTNNSNYTVTGSEEKAGINIPVGSSLTIYTQTTEEEAMGKLTAKGGTESAGIGGNDSGESGTLCIISGIITATGNGGGAGIGGGYGTAGGTTSIFGGIVTATAGKTNAAGIGGGSRGSGGTIHIAGGIVTATGTQRGAGIGGGSGGTNATVNITGGIITATSGSSGGVGIGCTGIATITIDYNNVPDLIDARVTAQSDNSENWAFSNEPVLTGIGSWRIGDSGNFTNWSTAAYIWASAHGNVTLQSATVSGGTPSITTDPSTLIFDNQEVNTTSEPKSITVSGENLATGIMYRTPTGYTITQAEGWDIKTGGTLYVTFTPTEERDYPYTLILQDGNDEPITTQTSITLSGTGIAAQTQSQILYFKDDGKLYIGTSDNTTTEYTEQMDKWSGNGSTLTLKGFEFETTASQALVTPANAELILEEGTENVIRASVPSGEKVYGIDTRGALSISGKGTLRVSAGGATDTFAENIAIYLGYGGNLNISDAIIHATSEGIVGNTNTSILVYGKIIINSGTIITKGGNVKGSYGFSTKTITINGGTITAQGYNRAFAYAPTVAEGATIKGDTDYDGENAVVITDLTTNNDDYKYINITFSKKPQTITFNALSTVTIGAPDFSPGATASSGLEVSYTSSNLDVATIVDGKIHIIAAGTTIITASQVGNDEYEAATDVAQNLTVNAPPVVSSDATLKSLTVSEGTLTPAFSASVTNYTVDVEYTVAEITITATKNNAGASVAGAGVKPLDEGVNTFDIVVTAEDGTTKTYTIAVTRATNTVGIDKVNPDTPIQIYPNSVTDYFQVKGITQPTVVSVYTLQGKMLLQHKVQAAESIYMTSFPNGIYLIKINGKTFKIVKE